MHHSLYWWCVAGNWVSFCCIFECNHIRFFLPSQYEVYFLCSVIHRYISCVYMWLICTLHSTERRPPYHKPHTTSHIYDEITDASYMVEYGNRMDSPVWCVSFLCYCFLKMHFVCAKWSSLWIIAKWVCFYGLLLQKDLFLYYKVCRVYIVLYSYNYLEYANTIS